MITAGIRGKQEVVVTKELTAGNLGSGELDVYATPAMVSLAEKTAYMSVLPYLAEGEGTVGTKISVAHLAATPLGMKVWCESELTEVDRRRLVFRFEVFDETGKVGEGEHERFIINNEKFLGRVMQKSLPH